MRSFRAAALSAAVLLAVPPALADGFFPTGLSAADQVRLQAFEAQRAWSIDRALAGAEDPADAAELREILAGSPMPIVPAEIVGEWQCRIAKLDGLLPLIIYDYFRCRIFEDGAGLQIVKLTGSQRTAGIFYDVVFEEGGDRLGYAGAQAWGDEAAAPRYGEQPDRDQVGYLYRVAENRLLLEFPLPQYESRFDIMELVR